VLPLSMYTEWYWKIDLHNLFHFLRLRMDAHAQFEVRAFAEAMATFVKARVPFAWEAFEESRLQGTFLTAQETAVLKPVDDETRRAVLTALHEKGYRSRRLKEVCRKLDIDERLVDELWPAPPKAGA
jgi:thymidylate synthase (FAD)